MIASVLAMIFSSSTINTCLAIDSCFSRFTLTIAASPVASEVSDRITGRAVIAATLSLTQITDDGKFNFSIALIKNGLRTLVENDGRSGTSGLQVAHLRRFSPCHNFQTAFNEVYGRLSCHNQMRQGRG